MYGRCDMWFQKKMRLNLSKGDLEETGSEQDMEADEEADPTKSKYFQGRELA
jgi:hypothetical protein